MRATLSLLLAAVCVLADESRGSKRPYVADAVGNTLPPPSNGPATVGSPVNLLTPDRYEFYTFDESGELVKRLMTLQEIQAIVAAGEEAEGLVTFANDNQPTIAFNFSQPPYTKVHSVVTNVQNVLKAQMEAHKNKPQINPTLDTPDVSDSWSLILPSIFGNTGVDIVPDKTSGSFTTPETETIEFDRVNFDDNLSKEGTNPIGSSTTVQHHAKPSVTENISTTTELVREAPTTTKPTSKATTTTTTTTTTSKPTSTTTTTRKPFTTTTSTTTTPKPATTTTTTTKKPTTTVKPHTTPTTRRTTTTTTTPKPQTTTSTTKLTTTPKPFTKTTAKTTTVKPVTTTRRPVASSTPEITENPSTKTHVSPSVTSTTEKSSPIYEKISTFVPVSTAAYVTERSTRKPTQTTKIVSTLASTTKRPVVSTTKIAQSTTLTAKTKPTITTYKPTTSTSAPVSSTIKIEEFEKDDASTITTQSVSPSTAISSTEFMTVDSAPSKVSNENNAVPANNDIKENETIIPLFDVAQSISQIASDLGSPNYQPLPTTSDLLAATHAMNMDLESKESLELDIPSESETESQNKTNDGQKNNDNFIKISTIHPHQQINNDTPSQVKVTVNKVNNSESKTTVRPEIISTTITQTPIDAMLSESMDDLLSQVVNQAPQSIVDNEDKYKNKNEISTTENSIETTTNDVTTKIETTSQSSAKINIISTTEQVVVDKIEDNNLEINVTKTGVTEKESQKDNTEVQKEKVDDNNNVSPVQNELSKMSSSDNNEKPLKPVDSHGHQTLAFDKQNNIIAIVNAPEPPSKEQSTPAVTETSTQKVVSHKTIPENLNKVTDKGKDDPTAETDTLPKIDEFKKKIQKVNIDYKEIANERNNSWKLISTVMPPKANEIPKDKFKTEGANSENTDKDIVLDVSKENQGLEVTTKDLSEDIAQFTELCNELAFRYWNAIVENIPNKRSFVLSPFSITSMLAMMFMGARGATSGEMNEILKLDDMVTFNPHFTLKNISDSIETTPESGVAISAFIRELYSDRNKGQILTFYKERAQHFYNGHVEEVNFKLISDIIRRRTNLLVKRYTWGKIIEYMKANTITMQPPLAAFSTNIFQTDCTGSSVEGRDGEMYFVVSPNVRQRRLVPVPAVYYKKGFLAGYDPVLDATAAALGNTNSIVSTIFLMPGQQGNVVHAEDLELLEKRLLDSNPSTPAWNRLLRTLLPRIGLELQIPRFSHKSIFNVSTTLKKMGLKDLFDADHADLGGLNGPSTDLYLSDMVQSTSFVTCGEGIIGEQHHIEEYPESVELARRRRTSRWATGWDEPRDYQRAFHDPHDVGDAMNLPLHLRPRQARLPARNAQPAKLKFDRPFLYFVRHNPSGMILYVGRYNPRLLP